MGPALKPKQVRVYLDETSVEELNALVSKIGSLPESSVTTIILKAALAACVEEGYRMPLPLKFRIVEPIGALNEASRETRYPRKTERKTPE